MNEQDIAKRQRIYDAMLIRAFRKDVTLGVLWHWLKPYEISPPDDALKRQPPPVKMTVRVFVGSYLKPLADRLWDTDPSQDIKTLDWMRGLMKQDTGSKYNSERSQLIRQSKRDDNKRKLLGRKLQGEMLKNQWGVTKASSTSLAKGRRK